MIIERRKLNELKQKVLTARVHTTILFSRQTYIATSKSTTTWQVFY